MRKIYLALAGAVALASSADAADDATTLKTIEVNWAKAFVTHDAAFVSSIVADDWSGFDPDGTVHNKAGLIAHIKDPKSVTKSSVNHGMRVRMLGANYAVVQGYETETSSYAGKNTSGTYAWTDVFAKRGGHWLAVNSQTARAEH